jgi:Flp pilus assembly protein TadB
LAVFSQIESNPMGYDLHNKPGVDKGPDILQDDPCEKNAGWKKKNKKSIFLSFVLLLFFLTVLVWVYRLRGPGSAIITFLVAVAVFVMQRKNKI